MSEALFLYTAVIAVMPAVHRQYCMVMPQDDQQAHGVPQTHDPAGRWPVQEPSDPAHSRSINIILLHCTTIGYELG